MKSVINLAFSTTTHSSIGDNQTLISNMSFEYNNNQDSSNTQWLTYFNAAQAVMTAMGLLLNLMTFVTFIKNGEMFSGVIRALLKHQAFADMLVCLLGILVLAIPPMQVAQLIYVYVNQLP